MSHDAHFSSHTPQGDLDPRKVRQMLSDVLPSYAAGAASEEEVRFVTEALPLHPDATEELVEYYALLDGIVASLPPPEGAPLPVSALMARIAAENATNESANKGRMHLAQTAHITENLGKTHSAPTTHLAEKQARTHSAPKQHVLNSEAGKSHLAQPRRKPTSRPWGAYALVAAALLAFGLSNIYWAWELSRVRSDTQSLISGQQEAIAQLQLTLTPAPTQPPILPQVLGSQHRNLTPTTTLDGMQGIFIWSEDETVGTLYVDGMPPLEQGRAYQLWLMRDEGTVAASLGVFTVDPQGSATLVFESGEPINSYQDIGISIEPLGGSPTPTTPNVAVASI